MKFFLKVSKIYSLLCAVVIIAMCTVGPHPLLHQAVSQVQPINNDSGNKTNFSVTSASSSIIAKVLAR
jgi:hypothetical protein